MISIYAIALATFMEAVRNKIVWAFGALAILAILVSRALGWVSSGEDLKVMIDVALGAMLIFGLLIASFISSHLLYQEEEKKSIYLVLSKPVSRLEYVLGKWFGLMGVLLSHIIVMLSLFLPFFLAQGGKYHNSLLVAVFTMMLEFAVVISLSLALSALTSPLFSAVMTFVISLLCHGVESILELQQYVNSVLAKRALSVMYHLLPNFSNFDYKLEAAHNMPIAINGYTFLYACAWLLLFLGSAVVITQNKQL